MSKMRRVIWPGADLAVDMHLHSTASDGTADPSELVRIVSENRLDVFALTDHDTLDGLGGALQALEARRRDGLDVPQFVPGVELSVDLSGHSIHLLGYFPAGSWSDVEPFLARERRQRERRNREMLAKLDQLGLPLDESVIQASGDGNARGRLHIARALVERGYFASIKDAFNELLSFGRPAYVARQKSPAAEAAALIRAAGGLSIVAHPQKYGWCPDDGVDEVPGEFMNKCRLIRAAGIDGIEAGHGDAAVRQQQMMLAAAAAFGLLVSQGSDYHGEVKPERPVRDASSPRLPEPVLVSASLVSRPKDGSDRASEREYLLFRRAESEPLAGYYELAGGKAEDGESGRQALRRELREELGVGGTIGSLTSILWREHGNRLLVIACYETELDGEPTLRVHDRSGWYTAEEALALPLLPADVTLFRRLAGLQD